jgi:Cft2 family RNA processing exonuclease
VRAKVERFEAFSAHADENDLERWLSRQSRGVRLFAVHGEADKLREAVRSLVEKGWKNAKVLRPGSSIIIR